MTTTTSPPTAPKRRTAPPPRRPPRPPGRPPRRPSRTTRRRRRHRRRTGRHGGDDGDDAAGFDQPEGEPDLDATFIYGYPITVSRLDPHKASISQDATTLFPVYDRLVHLSPQGRPDPGLAESWEFSDDGLTLTLHVREGVTFHDGATLDAAAVKANLDRAKGVEGSSVATDLAAMASVTVVDPMTVDITLSQPNVAIIGSLADRAGIMVSPKALADGVDLDANMVGAGPFKLVEHAPATARRTSASTTTGTRTTSPR